MISTKEIIICAIVLLKSSNALEWIPGGSSKNVQNFVSHQFRFQKPHLTTQLFQPNLDVTGNINFKKPKTQSYYKAFLVSSQSPTYEFRYKVHDSTQKNYQEKAETRVGNLVKGYYSVREPNGYVRYVKYVSDENGFQTEISHYHPEDDRRTTFNNGPHIT